MKHGNPAVIALTTDFGPSSAYVGQMKGVLLSRLPEVQLVDVTHAVPAQDVTAGALTLEETLSWFPEDTVHVVVVDPGVGTDRRLLAARVGRWYCVLPDNGLLALAADRFGVGQLVALDRPRYWLSPRSRTFHGRDIMAPVAAALAGGVPLGELGTETESFVRLELPPVDQTPGSVEGRVIAADSFGNLITNVREADLRAPVEQILCGPLALDGLVATYGEARPGEAVALIGSAGRLEIALVGGSAADRLGIGLGETIKVKHAR